ncbi:hypothetical protein Lal_00032704 [Lupinus albus]|nr:hypothetical protein Lal_00032704 [Lupinus albus]
MSTNWKAFVTTRTQDDIFLKISDENRKRASKPLYPYRASRVGYRGIEEKLFSLKESEGELQTLDSQVYQSWKSRLSESVRSEILKRRDFLA